MLARNRQSARAIAARHPVEALHAQNGSRRVDEGDLCGGDAALLRSLHADVLVFGNVPEVACLQDMRRRGKADGPQPPLACCRPGQVGKPCLRLRPRKRKARGGVLRGGVLPVRKKAVQLLQAHIFIRALNVGTRVLADDDVADAIFPAGLQHRKIIVRGQLQLACQRRARRPFRQQTLEIRAHLPLGKRLAAQG